MDLPTSPECIEIIVGGVLLTMEIDCGAVVSVISEDIYRTKFRNHEIKEVKMVNLEVVTGHKVEVLGEILVAVDVRNKTTSLKLYVIKSYRNFQSIIGRDWLDVLCPAWRFFFNSQLRSAVASMGEHDKNTSRFRLDNMHDTTFINEVRSQFPNIFGKPFEPIKDFVAEVTLRENAQARFHKPYTVPFSLREKVDAELERLENQKIIEKIKNSSWAAPLVLVEKKDGSIRLCGNFKVTVNPFLNMEVYPLPVIDDLLVRLSGHQYYCSIDLAGAYLQLSVEPSCRHLLAVNTPHGLYQFCRLPFGIASAPMIFQRLMDSLLVGMSGVGVYIDDILICGNSIGECKERLWNVLEKLNQHNLKINLEKCVFFVETINWLGHELSSAGISPCRGKFSAIMETPEPSDVKALQSYLGLLNYYSKFLPNFSNKLSPLYKLLRKDSVWIWTKECQTAFLESKHLMENNNILRPYDPKLPIIVACDAGPKGVGAILSNIDKDGIERPCYMVSSTLSKAEENYSQLHREALAVVFAIKRFHKFLYGYRFVVYTDHKPLEVLLGDKKALSVVASVRLHRWILFLSNYQFEIVYRPAAKQKNVDALSRLPLDEPTGVEELTFSFNFFNYSNSIPLSLKVIANETKDDRLLPRISEFVRFGWPEKAKKDVELCPFYRLRYSLELNDGCLYYANRIVIPEKLKEDCLKLLHKEHVGMTRMKMLARSYMWWCNIDKDIEYWCRNCENCKLKNRTTKECPNFTWPATSFPFERIHIDLFMFNNMNFLIVVDDFSKWIEVFVLQKTTAGHVIEKLKYFMSIFGFPKILVSDNGPQFSCNEFQSFCKVNGVKYCACPIYHPASNGLAERAVGTVKESLKKNDRNKLTIQQKLLNILFKYRNTPQSATGISPVNLLFSYKPRTFFSYLQNDIKESTNKGRTNEYKVRKLKEFNTVKRSKYFELKVGEKILYCGEGNNYVKWKIGFVIKRESWLIYIINVNGLRKRVHRNQLRKFTKEPYLPSFRKHSEKVKPGDQVVEEVNKSVVDKNEDKTDREINKKGENMEVDE